MISRLVLILSLTASLSAREVAITFDDVPDVDDDLHSLARQTEMTNELLAQLKRMGVPAIGFVNEIKVGSDPARIALLEQWHASGLDLGNHTFSHMELNEDGAEDFTCDIQRGDEVTRRVLGHEPIWFRHPYLETGQTIQERDMVDGFLAQHGYQIAPVTIDDSDWIFATAYDIAWAWRRPAIRRAYIDYMRERFDWAEHESRLVFGREIPQILLLHASKLNADTFDALAAMMRERGYDFITLDRAISDSAYASPDDWVGGGVGWIERWGITKGMDELVFEHDPQVPEWVQKIAKERED